jgi:Protein of unknown function (DUF1553)/Protein of unknown function (DUF1549)/Planctomycete cytochrome C
MKRYISVTLALLTVAVLLGGLSRRAGATDPAAQDIEFFEKTIRPLLAANCYECHSTNHKKRGGLLLDSRAGFMKGGDTGPVVVPGKPDESLIIKAVRQIDPELKMPKGGKLTDQQVANLEAWVAMGAPWPSDKGSVILKSFDLKERATHWSLQPIRTPSPPKVKNDAWCKSPIDCFLLAKLEEARLEPAAPADRRTLIRRVTFDLTGLPPTPEEIDAFLKDQAPDAFAKVVDRLLESSHYGERWGRHWLDLVRFAETYGHEFDFEIPEAFRYRDYVIRAFDSDVPFDQFVMEHIAGDLLPTPRLHPQEKFNESILGAGFWFLGEAKHSPVDIRGDQADRLDNQIDVFSKTFLAMTVACARCHDHKFDAISTKDYYSLAGYLQSARYQRAFIDDPQPLRLKIAKMKSIQAEIKKLFDLDAAPPLVADDSSLPADSISFADFRRKDEFKQWFVSGEAFGDGPSGGLVLQADPKRPVKAVIVPGIAHSGLVSARLAGVMRSQTFTIEKNKIHYRVSGNKGQLRLVIDGFQLIREPIYGGLAIQVDKDKLHWRTMDVSMWQGHRAHIEIVDDGPGYIGVEQIIFSDLGLPKATPANSPGVGPTPNDVDSARVAELFAEYKAVEASLQAPTRAMAMEEGTPVEERVFVRGNPRTLGEPVPRRFLEVFALLNNSAETPARLAEPARLRLAKKLVEPSNPLTARVIVNRLWKHHFGEGLVRTPDDFGVLGQTPSHPELLDWLAVELIKDGWSLKKMHRRMLLTNVYQMASFAEAASDQADPENKLLHRMPIRRLEAEAIRDAMLAVSGRLDRTMYGPGVLPYLTPFMAGRGRPNVSGPLDGNGRRSIYLNVRRNFLTPMLVAFDFPTPFSTIGKRSVSNVPAQALTLLNNPFVLQQAEVWARRILGDKELSVKGRIKRMYETAFARPPSALEVQETLAFVAEQGRRYGSVDDPGVWIDVAHVLFNVKEFIFVS